MTTFAVTYTRPKARGAPTDLEGPGTVTITTDAIVIGGKMPRTSLANGIAGSVALVGTFIVLMSAMEALDAYIRSPNGDMRLFVAIGLIVMVGSFAGVRAVLVRLLPKTAFEATLTFPFVAWVTPTGDRVEMMTNARSLTGITAFETAEASRFIDEFEGAKRGPQRAYR